MPPVRAPSPTTATTRRSLALQLEGAGHAVGVAEDGRGVAVLDPVVLGLGAVGVAGQPVLLAQVGEGLAAAGDQLVDVGLVAGVPQQHVAGRVEGPVEGQGQLDHAEVGAEVAAGGGDRVDDELPDLLGERRPARRGSATGGRRGCRCVRGSWSCGVPLRSGYQRTARDTATRAAPRYPLPWPAGRSRARFRRWP